MHNPKRIFRRAAICWFWVVSLLAILLAGLTAYLMYLNYRRPEDRAAEASRLEYKQPNGIFTCRYPKNWHLETDLAQTVTPGVTFADEVGSFIELKYYPADNDFGVTPLPDRRFTSAENYYAWNKQVISLDSFAVFSALVQVNWNKHNAFEFSLSYRRSFPVTEGVAVPDGEGHVRIGTPAKIIHVLEDVVIIPLVHGLFVATLSTEPDLYPGYQAGFRGILASLKVNDTGFPAQPRAPGAPAFPVLNRPPPESTHTKPRSFNFSQDRW